MKKLQKLKDQIDELGERLMKYRELSKRNDLVGVWYFYKYLMTSKKLEKKTETLIKNLEQ